MSASAASAGDDPAGAADVEIGVGGEAVGADASE
jgi:hypothetical protein